MQPPIAERHSKDVFFGKEPGKNKGKSKYLIYPQISKKDYYYWLRDDDRENKKVLKYLEDENKYTDHVLLKKGITVEKNKILGELRRNMVEDHDTVELPEGKNGFKSEYRFNKVFEKGKSYPIYYYHIGNKKVKYLDPNEFKKSETLDISAPVFNPNLTIFGYGIDKNGSEKYEIKLFNFPSLEPIHHDLPKILYSTFLITDEFIFYLLEDDANRPNKLIKYNLQNKQKELIYEVDDIEKQLQIEIGDDFQSIVYSIEDYSECETYVYWFDGPRKGQNIHVRKLKNNIEYFVKIYKDYFIIRTNANNNKNYGLKYCKIGGKRWNELIPYDEKVSLEYVYPLANGVLLDCRTDGEQFFRYLKLKKMKIVEDKIFKMGKGGYYQNIVYYNDSNDVIYGYQDLVTPHSYFKLNVETGKQELLKIKKVKNFDPSKYKVERIYVDSNNVKVPVDLLMLKEDKRNGKCLLYGYNSYGSNVEIKFDEKFFPLVDRGFVYAIANTRGSSYYGKTYYEDGMMLKKMNTFKDFIKVSEYLIKNKYCRKDGLSIEGRSAGGLLVSAVSILRPDLYNNVLAGVPFVDVLTTMGDSTIPLTTGEWLQWGNPNIKKYYNYIKKYSPIDNIKEGVCYPNYYIQAGLNDPRVAYWEPAKFTATLRYYGKNCSNIVLLKTDMKSGHFSSWDRYKNLEEIAERYAFIIVN